MKKIIKEYFALFLDERAWAFVENLLKDAAHMPYDGKEGFIERGYTVVPIDESN